MKKSIKMKWLSLMVTLFVAFGAMFSVATITKAKADGSDVTVTVDERYLNADEEFSFCVNAYSKAGFSSYQLNIDVPDFVKVTGIVSRMGGEDAEFVYAKNGSNTYRITFSSDYNETGEKTMFEVYASVDEDAQGRCDACTIYDAKFTNTNVAYLSVETNCAMFYVNGSVSVVKGDFNGDGIVDLKDVMLMQRAIAYGIGLTDTQSYAGDINKDGIIDIYDCQYIRSYLIGVIPSLDNIGGNDQPHGGEEVNISGEYIYQRIEDDGSVYTANLIIREDKSFIESFSSDDRGTFEGSYYHIGNKVYLVEEYELEIVYVNVEDNTFYSENYIDFAKEPASVNGYEDTYKVNGHDTDTVTVNMNGAFLRICEEDGHPMAYNGMISIEKVNEDKGEAEGVAYVFGTSASDCLMAMPFTLNTNNHTLSVAENNNEDYYDIAFFVNEEKVGGSSVKAGTPYIEVYENFLNNNAEWLRGRYGEIDFKDYTTDSGVNIFGGAQIYCNDRICFNVDEGNWTEIEKFYAVSSVRADGSWCEITLYYNATREDVLNALVGTTVAVRKIYVNDGGETQNKHFKNVELTADMIGDTSDIDFTSGGSMHVKIPLTIDGRKTGLDVKLVPDLVNSKVVKTGVIESTAGYSNGNPIISYYALRFYDNGFVAKYSISSEGVISTDANSYQQYTTEDYNGTTLYVLGTPAAYYVFSDATFDRTDYQMIVGYKHADGQETTDYILSIQDMGETRFKVFNGVYAEMWGTSYYTGELEYQGTVKVAIENGIFNFYGIEYPIGENNALSLVLPDKDPFLTTEFGGPEAWFYEGGAAFAVYNGQPILAFSWQGNADLTFISYTMMGHEAYFYKWAIDNKYHADEEPEWDDVLATFELVYVKNGTSKNYTLYRLLDGRSYLFDGDTVQSADAYYQKNIFEIRDNTGESVYYYYNADGEMYDAVRYNIVDKDKTSFGYVYTVPAKGILVGYWQVEGGAYISSEDFRFTVNGDGNYVVNYNDKWLFTATPVGKENVHTDNKLVLVNFDGSERYYQSHGGNNGESGNGGSGESGEEGYELNAYNVFNGSVMGGPSIEYVNSYEELVNKIIQTLSEQPDAPTFLGLFYDANGEMPVTEENFHSGDIYMIFVQNDESGNGNNGGSGEVTVEITMYAFVNGEVMGSNDPVTFNSYEEFADSIGLPSETISGVYYDTYGREEVTARNFHSGNVYIFYIAG